MIDRSLADSPHTVTEGTRKRVLAGLRLYEERGAEIERVAPGTYLVPSCTTPGDFYRISYGSSVRERCNCDDFYYNGERYSYKHLCAVAIGCAKRRRASTA